MVEAGVLMGLRPAGGSLLLLLHALHFPAGKTLGGNVLGEGQPDHRDVCVDFWFSQKEVINWR